jgi:hypothetical protein
MKIINMLRAKAPSHYILVLHVYPCEKVSTDSLYLPYFKRDRLNQRNYFTATPNYTPTLNCRYSLFSYLN